MLPATAKAGKRKTSVLKLYKALRRTSPLPVLSAEPFKNCDSTVTCVLRIAHPFVAREELKLAVAIGCRVSVFDLHRQVILQIQLIALRPRFSAGTDEHDNTKR